jgi:ABC-type multidrug transport system ATPase subunit
LHVNGHVLHYVMEKQGCGDAVKCAPVQSGSVAWLQQHDAFFERLTVKETLDLAVFLELSHLSKVQREAVSQSCLDALGLSAVQTRPVGSPKAARILDGATLSGGEMRRLSCAVELVVGGIMFLVV